MVSRFGCLAGLAAALLAAGCEPAPTGRIEVRDAWVRLPAAPGAPAAGYFAAEGGKGWQYLIRVETPAAGRVEMHESISGAHASMRPLPLAEFDPAGKLAFAPGGKHLMLFGFDPALKPRATIPLSFHFADGPPVTAAARLVGAGELPPGE